MLGLHRLNSFTPEPLHYEVSASFSTPKDFDFAPAPVQQNLYNDFDDVELKEEPTKYVIHFKDHHIKEKEVRIDFNREENELTLHVSNTAGSDEPASIYETKLKFEKPVSFDDIIADANGDNVVIQVPKLHSDEY